MTRTPTQSPVGESELLFPTRLSYIPSLCLNKMAPGLSAHQPDSNPSKLGERTREAAPTVGRPRRPHQERPSQGPPPACGSTSASSGPLTTWQDPLPASSAHGGLGPLRCPATSPLAFPVRGLCK